MDAMATRKKKGIIAIGLDLLIVLCGFFVIAAFSFLAKPEASIKLLRVLVRAALSPARCAPPSLFGMLFVKQ